MKSTYFAIVLAAAGILLAAGAWWRELQFERGSLRATLCRSAQDRCSQGCEKIHNDEVARINLEQSLEALEHRQRMIECRTAPNPVQCVANETARDAQVISGLNARKTAADDALETCEQGCRTAEAQCESGGSTSSAPHLGGGSFEVACQEGPGAPCYQRVDPVCQQLSGVCERCNLTLCGDSTWTFTSNSLQEALLVATGGTSPMRTLVSGAGKGSVALAIPNDLKLQTGESLELQFRFGGAPAKTRKVTFVAAGASHGAP